MAKLSPFKFSLKDGREVLFRSLTSQDAEAHLKFRQQIAEDSTHTLNYNGMPHPSIEEAAQRLKVQEEDEGVLNIAAFAADKMVAFLNFRRPYGNHPWMLHMGQFGMMILKDYWGCGIGKKLLELQEAHAKSLGVTRIEAMVRVENERGVKLYEYSGYKIEGLRRKAACIDGHFQDEYFIAKIFE